MTKIEKAEELIRSLVGCPYIYGAYGQECTTAYRRTVIAGHPDYTLKITNNCPVLSGKQSSCSGCKYKGKKSFDCRGLTWYVLNAVEISISRVGATTQWKTNSWQEKGTIDEAPKDKQYIVFRQDDQGIMQHTGFRCADGTVIDSRGHDQGVISANESTYKWTHYAIPFDAYKEYNDDSISELEVAKHMNVLYKATVVNGKLNLRAAPRTTSVALAYIPEGSIVEVLSEVDDEWDQVYYGETLGYVMSKFLQRENTSQEEEKPVEETTAHEEETPSITAIITTKDGNHFRHENVIKIEFE